MNTPTPPKTQSIFWGVVAASILQGCILIGEYVTAALPLWTGEELKVKTIPIDPRSLLRGQYVRLNYPFTQLKIEELQLESEHPLRNGEIVYITLKDAGDYYEYDSASLKEPTEGPFLRGRIANRKYEEDREYFRIRYGIEALFLPKEDAIEKETQLRDGGIATLMVASNGKARLVEVN